LRLGNPNPDAILLEGLQVKLTANGSAFGKALLGVDKSIPAFGNLDLDVPATLSNFALIRAGIKATSTGKLAYRMDTTVTFKDQAGSRYTRTVCKDGELDGRSFGP